jgi:hypothetical protein
MKRTLVGDIAILLLSLAVIVGSFRPYGDINGKPEVHVRVGDQAYVYDLSVDTFATFTGPVGETTIEIADGKVHVHDSDCRNKVCISAGWISKPGQWIVCLPNNVFVMIEGRLTGEEGGVDEIAF